MPVAIAGVVWGWILAPAGALNSVLQAVGLGGLVHDWLGDPGTALLSIMGMMIWFQVGFPLVIFFTALQRTDPILAEAASLDGASPWQSFIHVTLPQIRPSEIFVVVLMTTIATLKVFGQVYVLTRGGPGRRRSSPRTTSTRTSSSSQGRLRLGDRHDHGGHHHRPGGRVHRRPVQADLAEDF